MATTSQPVAPKPRKPLPKWQQKILEDIWREQVQPSLKTTWTGIQAKTLDALKGKPLIVIGGIVGALDAFLLKGSKPMPDSTRSFLTSLRGFAAEKLPHVIDELLKPPKPISVNARKALAGLVTLAGFIGVYKAGQGMTKGAA